MNGKRIVAVLMSLLLFCGTASTSMAADPENQSDAGVTSSYGSDGSDMKVNSDQSFTQSQETVNMEGNEPQEEETDQGKNEPHDEAVAEEENVSHGESSAHKDNEADIQQEGEIQEEAGVVMSDPVLLSRAHVQTYGWQDWIRGNTGTVIGTEGQSKRLEALELKLDEAQGDTGIEYRTHVQTYGWQDWKKNGETAGTTGQGKRIEAVQIRLTGEAAQKYDVYYRSYVQSYGWLNWTCNGEKSGSAGYGKRLEALEIRMVEKNTDKPAGEGESYIFPEIAYQAHVQTYGWQEEKYNGDIAGTTGQSKRLEALKIEMPDTVYEGGIEYQTYVQSYGWQDWKKDGETAGTIGLGKRVEGVRIRLTGEMADHYSVYYRAYVQSSGWLGWAKNGEKSGTAGYAKRLEAIEIRLIAEGDETPVQNDKSYLAPGVTYTVHEQSYGWLSTKWDNDIAGITGQSKRLEALQIQIPDDSYEGDIEYRSYIQGYKWQDWKKNGEISGTTNEAKRIEAVQIRLTGELADKYDVYYSVHVAKNGWLSYAKNGETAGSTDLSKRIEAIKIELVEKNSAAPDQSGIHYIEGYTNADFTYSGTVQGKGEVGAVQMGDVLGSTGEGKRLENISIHLNRRTDNMPDGEITYATHLSSLGWQKETKTDSVNGCTDGKYGIEAVKISLSGDLAKYYDVYYRAHVQKYGWLGWAKNGQAAGTTKCAYRLEALQIKLVSKDGTAPGPNSNYYTELKYRKYQNPSQYYQIKDSISLSGGGYILSYGFEGVKVMKVIQKLGLGSGIGMGGALYDHSVENAVRNFQKRVGLSATGNVDLLTWLRLGFNQLQWEQWGAYVSPLKVNRESSRSDHIEAMISTAYSYLGTPYVIGASGPPGTGIDCSGLVMQALYSAGLDISPINPVRHAYPGYEYESRNMWSSSKFMHVPYSQRQRGDLIFYQSSSGVVIHVAIYLGNNQVIESWPNQVVVWPIQNGQRSNIKGVVRPFV